MSSDEKYKQGEVPGDFSKTVATHPTIQPRIHANERGYEKKYSNDKSWNKE
jgi:hypothetical protein